MVKFSAAVAFVVGVLAGVPSGVLAAGEAAKKADERADTRPNIVFIMSDDHGWQAISAYGSNRNVTPNIDRIARDGMRMDRYFVGNSLCGPSRASILTGLHSHAAGFMRNGDTFDGSQRTMPKMMQAAGYNTALIGKWHLLSEPTGFDYSDRLIDQGPYYNPPMIRNGEKIQRTGYTTDIITDLAVEWLKEGREEGKPFMLMCQHKAPHREWEPAPRHFEMYTHTPLAEPATLFDDWRGKGTAAREQEQRIAVDLNDRDLKFTRPPQLNEEQAKVWDEYYDKHNGFFEAMNLEGDDLVRWKYRRYAADYLRCVAAVDEGVGEVLDTLDELGLSENTIVIYTSDQGWYLGEYGWFDKRFMYEYSFRTPFVVRWPGQIEPGSVGNAMTQNIDIAPTFLEVAGVDVPGDMHGASMLPVMSGRTPEDWRDSVYYHYYEFPAVHMVNKHEGVRTDRYKLINFYELDEWEFYDLDRDPEEMNNSIADPSYADEIARLRTELAWLRGKYGLDGPVEVAEE